MSTETLIQKVREQLGTLDAHGEQAVKAAVKILENGEADAPATTPEFKSRNITLEEYVALPRPERRRYLDEAEELNQAWVENQLERLGASWIMVVNGEVVLHGATMNEYPEHDTFIALCHKTEKYPFVFFSPFVFAIEESYSRWHKTTKATDAYPTVQIELNGNDGSFETRADLDTGATHCFAPLNLLLSNGLIEYQFVEAERTAQHLSQPLIYFVRYVRLTLKAENGASNQCRTNVFCVEDWQNSPFTKINPVRTFLMGRSVLLDLEPRLMLDFANRCTEVHFAEASS